MAEGKREITLRPGGQFNTEQRNNVGGTRTRCLAFTVPVNSQFGLPNKIAPILDLRTAAGAKVSRRTRIFVGVQAPTDDSPTFLQGSFELAPFVDLATSDQRKSENRGKDGTLRRDLGAAVVLEQDDQLIIEIEGPDVIDFDHADTVAEFDVEYRQL